jgi:myb proto-oncogene protein
MQRRLWSEKDDEVLRTLILSQGGRRWTWVAKEMKVRIPNFDRNGKQCRERWFNHLQMDLNKKEWTE